LIIMPIKKKILWVGYSPMTSLGLGKVGRELLTRLDDWDITMLAINTPWFDVSEIPKRDGTNIRILSVTTQAKSWIHYINMIKPDVVVIYGPLSLINEWCTIRAKNEFTVHPCKEIYYLTIETEPVPYDFKEAYNKHPAHLMITCSQWSADALDKAGIQSYVLSHGVDFDLYKHMEETRLNKTRWRVGTIARNDRRKGIVELIQGLEQAQMDPEKVELFLPCPALNDHGLGNNLRTHAYVNPDLRNQVIWCPLANLGLIYPEYAMPERYNTYDLHAFMTGGESFGLPVIEAAACEIPQLLTDLPVLNEIVGDNALYVEAKQRIVTDVGILRLPDPSDIAKALWIAYNEPDHMKDNAEAAKEHIKHMTWDWAVERLEVYLNE